MKFTKMHGIGNDYIYVNCMDKEIKNPSEISKKISDRHFGIGSDGLVLILPSKTAHFKMSMFNSDGSEAEMCGNAIRCVGKYVYENKMTRSEKLTIETLAGIRELELHISDGIVEAVTVDMGMPILEPSKIPVLSGGKDFINQIIEVYGKNYNVTCVSMGNPHAVVYMNDIDNLEIEKIGPLFEKHKLFPRKTNTEFVEVIDKQLLKMRVWERGAGETLACGTGACAVAVSTVLNGLCDREVTVKLLGGELLINWNENNNHVYMTGSATKVFDGTISIEGEGE